MTADALINGLPDLIVLIGRDGTVLDCCGGTAVPGLRPAGDCTGKRLERLWSEPMSRLLKQLTRKAIALRTTVQP